MGQINKIRKTKQGFEDLQGNPLSLKGIDKVMRDTLVWVHGQENFITRFDPENPLNGRLLFPGQNSPICQKCKLHEMGAKNPYFEYSGDDDPLITVIYENVSAREDEAGELAKDGVSGFIFKVICEMATEVNFDPNRIRWVPMTRCSSRTGKHPDYGTKGGWCRHHVVQDLQLHPPKIIMPVGSVVLGLLSHKSNAQDWGGKILTWRGWPDDWLTEKENVLPRPDPRSENGEKMIVGHPLFGPVPKTRRLMLPIQSPRIIYATQNKQIIDRWRGHIKKAMHLANVGAVAPTYFRPWYDISTDPEHIKDKLSYLAENEGLPLSFDTETSGLEPWGYCMTKKQVFKDRPQSIVFMMFRWVDVDGRPQSLGFPWNYEGSLLQPFLDDIRPYIQAALSRSIVIGHNLSFDARFIMADLGDQSIDEIAPACKFDTWHMAYTLRQQRGSLGLELLTYIHFPELAGYEEDFTLLIDLFRDKMHPENGGHYANCPPEYWDTHLKSYVMGDVEATYGCWESLKKKLSESPTYEIPLAHTKVRGRFRLYSPPSREKVYHEVISPASRVLIKMMARGMHIDENELALQEKILPKQVADIKAKLRESDSRILEWCKTQESTYVDWEFDLENKEILKGLVFDVLKYPVKSLTEGGRKFFGQDAKLDEIPRDDLIKYAAVDKYTLNSLAADHKEIRPLLEYRKLYKAWSSYIRPMRNAFSDSLDKKHRDKHPHLMRDGRVHGQFIIPGTRSGRLASVNPNLQQLPTKSLVKRCYNSRWAHDGGGIVSYDLSQIELRLIAAACGDEAMVDAYWKGIDLHSLSMSKIFKRPYEECTKEFDEWLQEKGRTEDSKEAKTQRKISKTINFLTGYGGGANGLKATLASDSVYFDIEQCEQFLEAFFDSYPALRNYLAAYKKFIAENAVAVSILGRVRVFEEVFSDDKGLVNKALRAGCNHLIQATASDMMLICLCVIEDLMRQENLESILVSTVHDSLVIDFRRREELDKINEIVMGVIQNMPEVMQLWFGPDFDLSWMIVPFDGDGEVGHNYYDLRTIPKQGAIDWDKLLDDEKSNK